MIDAASESQIDAGASVTVVTPRGGGKRIEAPHAGTIRLIAVAPDGASAISVDDLGGVRLWPTLDGQVEPRVVELPAPAELAIGPHPKGFEIALIDEAGGLVIQLVDRDGLTVQRATLGIEPTYAGIAMSDRGLLAWRTDQRIVRVSPEGALTAELSAEPGQRVLAIAVASGSGTDRGVAVIEGGGDQNWRRARWLLTGSKLQWGDWITAPGAEVGTTIAVAPGGKKLAYVIGSPANATKVVRVDGVTNAVLDTVAAPFAQRLEMPDDDRVVFAGPSNQAMWLTFDNSKPQDTVVRNSTVLAAGGGRVFAANINDLAIMTPASTQFLGYGLVSPQLGAAAPGGRLAIGAGEDLAILDAKLSSTPITDLPVGHSVSGLRWLAGDEWAVVSARGDGTGISTVAIVDLVHHKRTELVTTKGGTDANPLVEYEPSTELLSMSQIETPSVVHHVTGKQGVEPISVLPKGLMFERVTLWPVAPKRSGGTQMVVAVQRDAVVLRWVADPRKLDKGPTYTLEGALAAVDATGRAYVWQSDTKNVFELVMVRDGKRLGTLPVEDISGPVWPDPTGELVVATGGKITLLGIDGSRKWSRPWAGITSVQWLDDGALGIVTAVGVARLDAKTGEVLALRCGWNFGLSSKPHPSASRNESLCLRSR